jgi:hypothetical protein
MAIAVADSQNDYRKLVKMKEKKGLSYLWGGSGFVTTDKG